MLKLKNGEPKECVGKYLVNKTNLELELTILNQKNCSKNQVIDFIATEIVKFLNENIEE